MVCKISRSVRGAANYARLACAAVAALIASQAVNVFAQATPVEIDDVANVEGYVSGFGTLAGTLTGAVLLIAAGFLIVAFAWRGIRRYVKM